MTDTGEAFRQALEALLDAQCDSGMNCEEELTVRCEVVAARAAAEATDDPIGFLLDARVYADLMLSLLSLMAQAELADRPGLQQAADHQQHIDRLKAIHSAIEALTAWRAAA